MKHVPEIINLRDAFKLPMWVVVIHCQAHQNATGKVSGGAIRLTNKPRKHPDYPCRQLYSLVPFYPLSNIILGKLRQPWLKHSQALLRVSYKNQTTISSCLVLSGCHQSTLLGVNALYGPGRIYAMFGEDWCFWVNGSKVQTNIIN
jgi:hypothetical protein